MTETFHPLVKRLLDGELSLGDLPPELRGEGAEALRLLGAAARCPVALSAQLEARVMAEVRRRARSPIRRVWRRLVEPRDIELRLRVRPWVVWGAALAAAAAVALLVTRPPRASEGARLVRADARDSVYVRFVLYAPTARRVAVAGTFNQWDQNASPWGAWVGVESGLSRSRCPRGTTSTPLWWTVSSGFPTPPRPASTTASGVATAWLP